MKKAAYNRLSFALFLLLFVYLILRAIFVEPIKDELMTYHFYVDGGYFIGKGTIIDANNHLLNSSLAWITHQLGRSFFWCRIPSLLAFPFFFFWMKRFVASVSSPAHRLVLLLAVVCVPFTLEYFAACRGYGMALAFMAGSLVYLHDWIRTGKMKFLLLTCLVGWLMIASNASYLTIALIFGCIAVLSFVVSPVQQTRSWKVIVIVLLYVVSILPFVWYAGLLKDNGALYYGSLAGFWPVTLRTLLRYTLFYDAEWMRYPVISLSFLLIVIFAFRLLKGGIRRFLANKASLLFAVILAQTLAILFLAHVSHVNYPEDRVAMYFVPLTILCVGFLVLELRRGKFLIYLFLLFPLLFLFHVNLDSSVISPDDRMNKPLHDLARARFTEFTTIGGYALFPTSWAWAERDEACTQEFQPTTEDFQHRLEFVLTKSDLPRVSQRYYRLVGRHDRSSVKIWQLIRTPEYKPLYLCGAPEFRGDAEFVSLLSFPVPDTLLGKSVLSSVRCTLQLPGSYRNLLLCYSTVDSAGKTIQYDQFPLEESYGRSRRNISIRNNYLFRPLSAGEKEIRVYIWNIQRSNLYFYHSFSKLLLQDGPR